MGSKARGRGAPEVVADTYRGTNDDLDLAFWNVRGVEWTSRDQVAEVARVVADMGIDLWCLAHAELDLVADLREQLASDFGLEYGSFLEPAGAHPAMGFLYRQGKAISLERSPWGADLPEGVSLPPLITVRASTRRAGTIAFQLVPVGRPTSPDAPPAPYAEAVRHAIRRGQGEFDWIVVGEASALLAPEKLHVLADCDRELLAAADRDGAVALLTGPRSKVSRVFVSPNLLPAFGVPETLTVARDREFPPMLRALGGQQPIALRLSLDADPRPPSATPPTIPLERPHVIPPADDDLERRVRDLIAPILAKLLSETRPRPE